MEIFALLSFQGGGHGLVEQMFHHAVAREVGVHAVLTVSFFQAVLVVFQESIKKCGAVGVSSFPG